MMTNSHTITTHDNLFHLDDLFACAIIQIFLDKKGEKYQIVRTRDKELILKSDYVVDVGDIYDISLKRFDHHQKGGAGTRDNGIPYASAGLVWKEYGEEISGNVNISNTIDRKLIQTLDADDNGVEYYKNITDDIETITIHKFLYTFRPTWKEDPKNFDTAFEELLPLVKNYILRKVKVEQDKLEALERVEEAYNKAEDKRIVLMDKPYPGDDFLMTKPEVLYKISPNSNGTSWGVKTIRDSNDSYENRKDLPKEWAGLRDEEMHKATGVKDAIFCHNALFLATADSKEGALELARLAVEY
jgi:uncharacterized UPF0160 family protein